MTLEHLARTIARARHGTDAIAPHGLDAAIARAVVEQCALFCEQHEVGVSTKGQVLSPRMDGNYTHAGDAYAKGLRALIAEQ